MDELPQAADPVVIALIHIVVNPSDMCFFKPLIRLPSGEKEQTEKLLQQALGVQIPPSPPVKQDIHQYNYWIT